MAIRGIAIIDAIKSTYEINILFIKQLKDKIILSYLLLFI
jgi:hypothetical protein